MSRRTPEQLVPGIRASVAAVARKLTNGEPVLPFAWVISGVLAAGPRPLRYHPLYGGRKALPREARGDFDSWVQQVRGAGIRSMIVHTHTKQLRFYDQLDLGGDLVTHLRAVGFRVEHLPLADPAHGAAALAAFNEQIADVRARARALFIEVPKPVLVFCSGGMDRSSPVAAFLAAHHADELSEP